MSTGPSKGGIRQAYGSQVIERRTQTMQDVVLCGTSVQNILGPHEIVTPTSSNSNTAHSFSETSTRRGRTVFGFASTRGHSLAASPTESTLSGSNPNSAPGNFASVKRPSRLRNSLLQTNARITTASGQETPVRPLTTSSTMVVPFIAYTLRLSLLDDFRDAILNCGGGCHALQRTNLWRRPCPPRRNLEVWGFESLWSIGAGVPFLLTYS